MTLRATESMKIEEMMAALSVYVSKRFEQCRPDDMNSYVRVDVFFFIYYGV